MTPPPPTAEAASDVPRAGALTPGLRRVRQAARVLLMNVFLLVLIVQAFIHVPFASNFSTIDVSVMARGEALVPRLKPNLRDANYMHSAAPGMESGYDNIKLSTNAEGFRDVDHTVENPAGRKRVAFMGDSFVFGLMLNDAETLSSQLQRALGDDWEVFNFGLPGINLQGMGRIQQTFAAKYRPDIVVYSFICDDVSFVDSIVHQEWHAALHAEDQWLPGAVVDLLDGLLVNYKMARYKADFRVMTTVPGLYEERLLTIFAYLEQLAIAGDHWPIFLNYCDEALVEAAEIFNATATRQLVVLEGFMIELDRKSGHPTARSNASAVGLLAPLVREVYAAHH